MVGYNTSVVPRNVVIYARESTEHEAQLSALENQLDWYLFFSGEDNTPKSCNVSGNKKSHKIELSDTSSSPFFAECNTGCNRKQVISRHAKTGEFMLFADDAKKYLYSKSTKHRILNWRDIHVQIYI